MNRIQRFLLALCALVLALGGFAHARAFGGAARAVGKTSLSAHYANDFKTLWLADSATLLIVAALLALLAIRPAIARRTLLLLITLIPAATGVLIFIFVGNFYAGHLLVGAAAVGAIAGGTSRV